MSRPIDADLDKWAERWPPDDVFEEEYSDENVGEADGEPPDPAFVSEAYAWADADAAFEMDARREDEAFERLEAGLPVCRACGCTAVRPCLGGCVWATETLCSRCA